MIELLFVFNLKQILYTKCICCRKYIAIVGMHLKSQTPRWRLKLLWHLHIFITFH